MRYFSSLVALLLLMSCKQSKTESVDTTDQQTRPEYAMVIHGGAGTVTKDRMTPEREAEYLTKLHEALDTGEAILAAGGSATDAVVATISLMEDSPLFNAGKGAVFTHDGINELDASIMDGSTQNAGAVGGVTTIKNPITAARAVMDQSKHVMMVGKGAETFASEQGITSVAPEYFKTDARWETLQRALAQEKINEKMGTVGCVALDKNGNLAAGTSTGGMTNKRYNRIGDSPIIGAGTYADNATCGVSCTGHGEYFIRYTVARDIAAQMEYGDKSLDQAANTIVMDKLVEKGGLGGVVALDKMGNVSMPFNTSGMYRGYVKPDQRSVAIYKSDVPMHNPQLATKSK